MRVPRSKTCAIYIGFGMVAALATPIPSSAQDGNENVVYEREVFQYPAASRPDPFRSLLEDGDLGIRVEDLSLRGVVHHADPSQSVAFLLVAGTERRIQARVGERVGSLRVLGIFPDRVDVVVEELGVARRETLRIQSPPGGPR